MLLVNEQWDAKCLRIAAILAAITGIVARETEQRRTMGTFIYEGHQKAEIEDRALIHLQLVITAKLRRGEPFPFTWREDMSVGGGRTTVWLHEHSSITFKYHGSRQPPINRAWTDALAFTANAPSGLYLTPEPHEGTHHDPGTSAPSLA